MATFTNKVRSLKKYLALRAEYWYVLPEQLRGYVERTTAPRAYLHEDTKTLVDNWMQAASLINQEVRRVHPTYDYLEKLNIQNTHPRCYIAIKRYGLKYIEDLEHFISDARLISNAIFRVKNPSVYWITGWYETGGKEILDEIKKKKS